MKTIKQLENKRLEQGLVLITFLLMISIPIIFLVFGLLIMT